MQTKPLGFFVFVALGLSVLLILSVFPITQEFRGLRPEFICLFLIYLIIVAPFDIGIVFAFVIGLVLSALEGLVLGSHSLALSIIAYITLSAYQRMKNYSIWHQAMWIFVLVGLHQVLVNWMQGIAGYAAPLSAVLASTIISALIWPPFVFLLNLIRRQYRIA